MGRRKGRERKPQQPSAVHPAKSQRQRGGGPLERREPPLQHAAAPDALMAELTRQHGPLAICTAFLTSAGIFIYLGGVVACSIVFFSTLWALFKLTMSLMQIQKDRGR